MPLNAQRWVILVLVPLISTALLFSSHALAASSQEAAGLRFNFDGLTLSPSAGMTEGALKGWHEEGGAFASGDNQ